MTDQQPRAIVSVLIVSGYTKQQLRLKRILEGIEHTVTSRTVRNKQEVIACTEHFLPDIAVITPIARNRGETCDIIAHIKRRTTWRAQIIVNSHSMLDSEPYRINGATDVIRPKELKSTLIGAIRRQVRQYNLRR